MTGEELFEKYGQDVLGPWASQAADVQRSWEELAVQVTATTGMQQALVEVLGEPIKCPNCGMTSFNPNDVREGYCGNCHDWTTPR